jgi:hypothetical protein
MIWVFKRKFYVAFISALLILALFACNPGDILIGETGKADNDLHTDGEYELYYVSVAEGIRNPSTGLVFVDESDSLPELKQSGYIIVHYSGEDSEITLPKVASDGVPIIGVGKWAFCHAEKLKTVIIPSGYQYVFSNAFTSLKNLSSIYLSESIEYISGGDVFMGCDSLREIKVDDMNSVYVTIDECILLRDTMELIVGGSNSDIPEGTKIIGSTAFYGRSNHESIRIPSSVTTIKGFAFGMCENVSFYIGENVTQIEDCAFIRCKNATFYCEAKIKPDTWHDSWYSNGETNTVVWGS